MDAFRLSIFSFLSLFYFCLWEVFLDTGFRKLSRKFYDSYYLIIFSSVLALMRWSASLFSHYHALFSSLSNDARIFFEFLKILFSLSRFLSSLRSRQIIIVLMSRVRAPTLRRAYYRRLMEQLGGITTVVHEKADFSRWFVALYQYAAFLSSH